MKDLNRFIIDSFQSVGDFLLEIHFHDGKIQKINFSKIRYKKWMKRLEDLNYFNQVIVNESGYLEWPNGEDFVPDHLYYWERFQKYYLD